MPFVLDNSILQSYLAGMQVKQQKEQQAFENEQKVQQQDLARQQFELYKKHLDAQMKSEQSRLEMERAGHELNAQKFLADSIASGHTKLPTENRPVSSMPSGMGIPGLPGEIPQIEQTLVPGGKVKAGGFEFDASQFASPQELVATQLAAMQAGGNIEAETAGKKAAAIAKAQTPFKIEEEAAKQAEARKTEEVKQTGRKEIQGIKDAAAMERTRATVEGQKASAAIRASATVQAAKFKNEVDPVLINDTAMAAATGQLGRPLGLNTKVDLPTRRVLHENGLKEVDQKTFKNIKALHNIQPVIQQMEEYADMLPDSAFGIPFTKIASKLPTELRNKHAIIESQALVVGRGLEGETGRVTNQMMQRVDGLFGAPGMTKSMAKERLQFLKTQILNKALGEYLGGISNKQRILVLQSAGFDPSEFNTPIPGAKPGKDGKIPTIFMKDTDGEWLYYDPKRNGHASMDH